MTDAELVVAVSEAVRDALDKPPDVVGPAEHIRQFTVGWVTQAVLAAIRASGRLAPEVDGDVVEAAVDARFPVPEYSDEHRSFARTVIAGAAPLIAAAAEAKLRGALQGLIDAICDDGDHGEGANDENCSICRAVTVAAAAIRTGAAS